VRGAAGVLGRTRGRSGQRAVVRVRLSRPVPT
jgi:hypothetical protein